MHSTERVIAYIDGFNLYHALHDLGRPHLKWVDLATLVRGYAAQPHQQVVAVNYFSAFATWLTAAYARHRQYVEALRSVGVTPIMGRFKEKDRECSARPARTRLSASQRRHLASRSLRDLPRRHGQPVRQD